jgi:DNA modification methylase
MTVRIMQGDVREKLAELPADFFDCIVTSPPYYGLRDYGTARWEGGDPACDHRAPSRFDYALNAGLGPIGAQTQQSNAGSGPQQFRSICKCGARRIDTQIGLEPTLDAYLETMVGVCRELRRVLKPSGVFFLNIGDSYAGAGGSRTAEQAGKHGYWENPNINHRVNGAADGLKPKDLCLVPERLGIALQADGWLVRSHIIWAKKNPMPESCTDRPTSAHETIWMLTKSQRYFWDAEAVKEDRASDRDANGFRGGCYVNGEIDNGIVGQRTWVVIKRLKVLRATSVTSGTWPRIRFGKPILQHFRQNSQSGASRLDRANAGAVRRAGSRG